MRATIRSGAITGPGRLRITAIPSATTSTIASAANMSLTFSQKPSETVPKLSLKPVSEKKDSTTLLTPGERDQGDDEREEDDRADRRDHRVAALRPPAGE